MHLVFLTPYKKTYSSDYCSLSTFIGFVFLILSIFLPLFAALSSEDFWLRLKEYLEQPKVEFTNDYMLYVSFLDSSTKTEKTFFYSSVTKLNSIFNDACTKDPNNLNNGLCLTGVEPVVTASQEDNDDDGINDKLNLRFEIDSNDIISSTKKDVKIIFFLKYRLTKTVKLIMTPMIYVGRENDDEIIYFNAIGTGMLDLAVTTRCYRKAVETGVGTKLLYWED